ncbi:hypothetical protein GH5_03159 [Leishmania sp. Ghana 2012 LV757]|uniref:hypothetical protein n=1 Tax=Leishmania sp. Ghana 2012 LV757 TaxID=2803181 RepID=UPI001B615850|nr:hypothetical protein GH5_03159 [Leishmania sp. Ghana 2012 LV757]
MPSAIGTGTSASPIEDVGEKDVDEVNTHTSESVCSSSSSTDADVQAATPTVRTGLGALTESPVVKDGGGSMSCYSHECVSCHLRIPTSAAPCGALKNISIASTAAAGDPGVVAKGVSDSTCRMPAPVSSLSTRSAKPTPAPPPPIDFVEVTPAAAGSTCGPERALASTSDLASSLRLSSSRPEAASALFAVVATAPAASVASHTGNGSRLPLSPAKALPCAGPRCPDKLVMSGSAAIRSVSSAVPQISSTPHDYMSLECRPPQAVLSSGYRESSSTVSSRLVSQQLLIDSTTSPRGSQHLRSTSHSHSSEVSIQVSGHPCKMHWQRSGGSQHCYGHSASATFFPAGGATSKGWAVSGLADESCRVGTCVAIGTAGGEMSAYAASAAASEGAEQSGLVLGMPDCVDSRQLSVAHDCFALPSPSLGLYTSVLPDYSAGPAPALPHIGFPPSHVDPMGTCGGENEYGDWRPLDCNGAPKYGDDSGTRYRDYVPQDVQYIEHLDHLDHACRQILLESEMLRMRREQQRRTRLYCVADDDAEEAHWSEKLTIALDLEGRSLGRTGSICIITLATYTTVYIIDLVLLGAEALCAGSTLRYVLESCDIVKLMFDCRADCDALFFLYGVRLQSVCDLQISSCFALFPTARRLPGMKGVFLALGLFADEDTEIKNAGRHLFNPRCGGSFDRWEERPLTGLLVQYCAVDVKYFFLAQLMLWDHVEQGCRLGEARLASVCSGNFLGSSKVNCLRDFDIA